MLILLEMYSFLLNGIFVSLKVESSLWAKTFYAVAAFFPAVRLSLVSLFFYEFKYFYSSLFTLGCGFFQPIHCFFRIAFDSTI